MDGAPAHRILVVEDEPLIAEDLADLCRGGGYPVCGVAYSTREAVELVESMRPTLALLDVHLGEETDGIHLARRLRGEFGIPFIFITSYVDRGTLDRAKETLPLGYIVKPFRNEQVLTTLAIALEQLGHFTPRELDFARINRRAREPVSEKEAAVLSCLYQGMDTQTTARTLFVSVNTVKFHLKNLHGKFGVRTRVELLRTLQELMAG